MERTAAICFVLLVCACGPSSRGSDDVNGAGDEDGDGYSPDNGDCDDANADVHPGAGEVCTDSIDNDCNGMTDSGDYNCMTPCEKAAYDRSSVGCVYFAVDTNPLGGPYALAVSNVDSSNTANVVIEQKTGTTWAPVTGGTFSVGPKMLQTLTVPRRFVDGSAIYAGGAYRITSDLPVISYQFAPIDGSASYLSDASLLLPVSALDKYYIVSAWPYGADVGNTPRPARIQIAAAEAAQVTVTSPITWVGGTGVPANTPGAPQQFTLAEGDFLQLTVSTLNQEFTGAYIDSTAPVAVFSSNDCANVPNIPSECCCDHLEEQLFGLQTWGKSYVAAQMPRRQSEGSIWQILAQQDGTNITFSPSAGVTGLPPSVTLNAREKVEYEVRGSAGPGDFLVTADKPILVNQFTVGAYHVQSGSLLGDPDMVQAVPTEQFLAAYTILVPATWTNDYLVITRKEGTMVLVDGVPPNVTWNPVPGGWQTGVLSGLADGVHTLESNIPFGVHVNGYDEYDSYAYPGGLNQTVINPIL
jgi:hypothetical protein